MSETLSGILAEGLQLLIRAAGGGAERELFAAAFLCRVAAMAGFTRSQTFQLDPLGMEVHHINTLTGRFCFRGAAFSFCRYKELHLHVKEAVVMHADDPLCFPLNRCSCCALPSV